jgi:hypothetical protein
MDLGVRPHPVIPAEAGIQFGKHGTMFPFIRDLKFWIPACTGMTKKSLPAFPCQIACLVERQAPFLESGIVGARGIIQKPPEIGTNIILFFILDR